MSDAYRVLVNRDLPIEERACGSKVPYVTRREAKTMARSGHHTNGCLEPYRCWYCESWHLGHRHK